MLISTAIDECVSAADRNKIHARFGVRANIFQGDAAGAFEGNAARMARTNFDRFAHILDADMVEQNCLGAMGSACCNSSSERTSISTGWLPRRLRSARSSARDHSPGERDVVVLDQHAVGKIEAVILAAAAAHRILVDHAQAGRGLARIENARRACRKRRRQTCA